MKKLAILSVIGFFGIIISSCGSSNNVVNNHGISKRKYTKGYFFQRNSNVKSSDDSAKNVELKDDRTIAKAEKKQVRAAIKENQEGKEVSVELNQNYSAEAPLERTESGRNVITSDAVNQDGNSSESPLAISENEEKSASHSTSDNTSKEKSKKRRSQGGSSDLIFVLAIIFAILIPPLGVAIHTNIDWLKVLIAFLLTLLFVLPGIIYALLVVFDVI